jgi:GntR family transcriptional regulator, rspAB operon transcriptional repressor
MDEVKPTSRANSSQAALAHTIFEGLRDEITSGKFKPGEALSRRGIAHRYGTSSIPVIEALARLESTGLIEAEARQAARVRKISLETIQEDYILREAFETQAIRLACETATASEIEKLYRMAEAVDARVMAGGTKDAADKEGPMLHWQFHRQIARISRCRAIVQELERIELLRRLQANWYYAPESPDPPRHHSMLVDAVSSRDPVRADAAMRTHVRNGLEKELLAYRMKMDL